jgi:DNA helicase-2/ATP-dependent DNA helicase PcrA
MPELNPPQQNAVDTLSGPLLVLAGAGTGKTRVVTFRVANLIRNGIRPDRILAVTFTNKASQEMQERISHQLKIPKRVRRGQPAPLRPAVGTFHSHCVQILKRHANVLGYPAKFTIYDRSDAESVARTVLREIRVHDEMLKPGDFLSIVSRWKNLGVRPEQADGVATSDKEHLAASAFKRYQRSLKNQAAFDFDDLLVCAEQLLNENEKVRREESSRYDHVLVDEYQDTNGSQYRIIQALAIDHRNLCVVGDDDQSIYGWRGAEVRHILNFKNDWSEAKVVRLEDNYRSTDAILQMANRLIVFNTQRHDKDLRAARPNGLQPRILQFAGEAEEAKGVVEEIAGRLAKDPSTKPGDFAILFRTNEQPRPFEMELRRCKLPYVITGSQSFFDRKEVRDILAYLKWIETPEDELSLLRVINVPPRGMGAASIDKLLKKAVSTGTSVWKIMQDESFTSSLPTAAQQGVQKLKSLSHEFSRKFQLKSPALADSNSITATAQTSSSDLEIDESDNDNDESDNDESDMPDGAGYLTQSVRELIHALKYRAEINRLYPDAEEATNRIGTLDEVINAIAAIMPELWGGSADLAESNNTTIEGGGSFLPACSTLPGASPNGRILHFGIREHAMGSILNGIALDGLTRPFGGTFMVFSDYMRGSVRLAALMQLPSIFVWTHDSIGLGEDGPTHQPVEHLWSLRAVPGLSIVRPADANETSAAWHATLSRRTPVGLVLTRQNLPTLVAADVARSGVRHGAYVLVDSVDPQVLLLATGSEVQLAVAAHERLKADGISARVVSMPCLEWFEEQDEAYRDSVLLPSVRARVAIEAGSTLGWWKYVGDRGRIIGIDHFGASADQQILFEEFGITVDAVVAAAVQSIRL